ncbi:MAG: hypothetical protein IT328_13675 [Caldilineaceae bacterium]|nr:hypothetical protein [Caldilineaceae bacterium]
MPTYRRSARLSTLFLLLIALSLDPLTITQLHAAGLQAETTAPNPSYEQPSEVLDTGFVIDHNSVALFEQIPDGYVTSARNLRMLFSDRSVGQNINEALDCLTASSWERAPASCRRDYYDTNWNWKTFTAADRANGLVPPRILFDPDPAKYNRNNWTFEFKGGGWSELTQDFIQVLAPGYIDAKDVLSYQFSYLNVNSGSDIANPTSGFFSDNPNRYDIHDLEAYMAQYPTKTFILWTTSLARGIGTQEATDFNSQMRQYAAEHNKILFDMADIISHTDQDTPCYDNQNDGQNFPAICQDYTTEADGGHLGSVSGGKIRMAKAFWVLMARIAGWDGVSSGGGGGDDGGGGDGGGGGGTAEDLIFADGFESGNLEMWSNRYTDRNDLAVARSAALIQRNGLRATIDDNVALSVVDEHPMGEARYRARFYFDPNSIAMAENDLHVLFSGYSGTELTRPVIRVELYYSNSTYRLRAGLLNDAASWRNSAPIRISDAPHVVEFDWKASTQAGANNGSLGFWIDEIQRSNLTGIDNDTYRIERVRLGPLADIDDGTRGTYNIDAFESRRQSYIGQAAEAQPVTIEDLEIEPAELESFTDEDEVAPPEAGPFELPWEEDPSQTLENPLYLPLVSP